MAAEGSTLLRRNDELPGEAGAISDIIVLVVLGQTQHVLGQELGLRRDEKGTEQPAEGGDPGDLEPALFSQHMQGEIFSCSCTSPEVPPHLPWLQALHFSFLALTSSPNCHNCLGPTNKVALSSLLVLHSILPLISGL